MNADASLPDEDLQELEIFLMSEDMPENGMDISALDGYVAAIARNPQLIAPSRWLSWVWDMEDGHYCPIKWSMLSRRSSIGAGCMLISFGAHLNFEHQKLGSFSGLTSPRSNRGYRQNPVCSDHGVCAMDELCAHRAALRRQLGRAHAVMRRAVPRDRLRAADVAESRRDIEGSLSANATKLYAMGFRWPVKRSTGRRDLSSPIGSTPS